MGMADPLPEQKIFQLDLLLERNDDKHLTCWFCHGASLCEWQTTLRLYGRRVTVGVHEHCLTDVRSVTSGVTKRDE